MFLLGLGELVSQNQSEIIGLDIRLRVKAICFVGYPSLKSIEFSSSVCKSLDISVDFSDAFVVSVDCSG